MSGVRIPDVSLKNVSLREAFFNARHRRVRTPDNVVGRGARRPGDVCSARTEAERRQATYEEIRKYVAEHNDGMKVSNLYIAQVKAKYGIIERENYNKPKSDDSRQPKCPKEKEEAIVEALKAFKMI